MELLKPKRPVKGMVVASEKHEDGSPHLHAFVLLKSRYGAPIATSGTLMWVMRFTTPTSRNAGRLVVKGGGPTATTTSPVGRAK